MGGGKKVKRSTKSPQYKDSQMGRRKLQKLVSKLKKAFAMKVMYSFMYIILRVHVCIQKKIHYTWCLFVFKYIYHQLHKFSMISNLPTIFFVDKMSFKIKKNAENHISFSTNTYILYKYIHKYILHTTAINLKRGYIEQRGKGGCVSVF